VERALADVEGWMVEHMPQGLSPDEFEAAFVKWEKLRAQADQIDSHNANVYRTANPSEISMLGIQRYWRKYRQEP
jgi:hypothetical protein